MYVKTNIRASHQSLASIKKKSDPSQIALRSGLFNSQVDMLKNNSCNGLKT